MTEDLPDLEPRLAKLVAEAASHRWSSDFGKASQSPPELLDELVAVRRAMDRVEAILADIVRVRARTAQEVADRRAALNDHWNDIASKSKVGFAYGDAAPRERYARYSQETIPEERALRRAEKLDREVGAAQEIVRTFHRGLEGVRRDLDLRIRLISLAGQLER